MRNLHFLGGGGDKQTFLIACLALEIDCRVVEYPLAEGGVVVDGAYCGRTMVQVRSQGTFDPPGWPLSLEW
jgi:alpha 1,2-mannosyltransferase